MIGLQKLAITKTQNMSMSTIFLVDFEKTYGDNFYAIFERKVLVLNSGILSVVCHLSASVSSLQLKPACGKRPEIFTKSQVYYHRVDLLSMRWIFDFRDCFSWQVGNTCPMSEKNITKMSGICIWYHISSPNFHRMYV